MGNADENSAAKFPYLNGYMLRIDKRLGQRDNCMTWTDGYMLQWIMGLDRGMPS